MKHWKRIGVFVLLVVLLITPMIKSTSEPPDYYHFKFSGGYSNHYTMKLPNDYRLTPEGQTDSFSGKNIIIGSAAEPRTYTIRGEYTYKFGDNWTWNERVDRPYIRIQGGTPSLYRVYPEKASNGTGSFEIPAGGTAILEYNSGHYISKFLSFWWITNQWGINGECTIKLYFDTENPDPPQKIKLNGVEVTKVTTGGTVDLSWDAVVDHPTDTCEASGVKGYKIFDGPTDITPEANGGFITGLSQAITLVGEGEHTIKIRAYDHENNASLPATVYVRVDQTPPTGNLSIQSNNGFTNNSYVTLLVTDLSDGTEGSGLKAVSFSNDNVNYSDWVPCSQSNPTQSWPLSPGEGLKTVYLKLKDQAGNITTPENAVPATVTLDTTAPNGIFSINNGAQSATSQQVILTLTAEDDSSGMAGMMFSNDGVNYSITETYNPTKSWILSRNGGGAKTVFVRFTDIAGNTSTGVTAEIAYDPDPVYTDPTPETTLLADETWTENRTLNGKIIVPAEVTLTIGSGVTVTIGSLVNNDPYQNGFIIEGGGTLIVETGVTFNVQSSKPGWMGIIISGTATITGANISMAQRGIAILSGAAVTVSDCVFSINFTGIHVYASHPAITNCTFQGNIYGIKEDEIGLERPVVNGCIFTSNWVAYYHDPKTRITMNQLNDIPGNGDNQ